MNNRDAIMRVSGSWYEPRQRIVDTPALPVVCDECGEPVNDDWIVEEEQRVASDERHYEIVLNWYNVCHACGKQFTVEV